MKKIVIIGGGIAGLSAGIYAQLNGFESIILEKNTIIGGECIGWEREGCYIDGCIHWLTGSNSGEINRVWKRVGALENIKIIEPEYLYQYINGKTIISLYRDIDKLKEELLSVSKDDSEQISEFINYIKALESMSMPTEPLDQMNLGDLMKFMKSMKGVSKIVKETSSISLEEYATRLKSDDLKKFILSYMPKDYQLMSFLVSIATFTSGNGNIPEGKSIDFSNRMRDKYLSLGGIIYLNKTVSEIVIKNKLVEEVITASKEVFHCDYLIPSCDVDVTFHKLLKNKYNDKKFEKRYLNEKDNPLISNCYFAYTVDKNVATTLPHMSLLESEGIKVANKNRTTIGLKVYDYINNENGLVTAISPLMQDGEDYDYWESLYKKDKTKYKSEKLRIGEEIRKKFILQYPQLEGNIKLIDSATPMTYQRYLGAYKGSYMSFMLTKKSKQMMHNGKIKNIKNLFMAGQWLITPGGLPTALMSGKFALQRICKTEKKEFIN